MIHVYNEEQLKIAVKNAFSLAQTLKNLNIEVKSNNYVTLKRRIKLYDIDTSHFTGQAWCKNRTFQSNIDINDYLTGKRFITTHALRIKLIKSGILEHKCYKCNLVEWNNQPIPIELHHIDGNNKNNELSNLKILCPNCHAQTENYCSKNIKSKNPNKRKNKTKECKCGNIIRFNSKTCKKCHSISMRKITEEKWSQIKFCQCGKEIHKRSKLCRTCYEINNRKVLRPSKEDLINDIKNISFLAIGKKYNVTDNSIRKWCKQYNIDYKSIKQSSRGDI